MTNPDIERAARAAEDALNVLVEPGTPEHPNITTVGALANAVARAALSAALSEPSEAVVEAANVAYLKAYRSGTSSLAGDMRAALVAVGKLFSSDGAG